MGAAGAAVGAATVAVIGTTAPKAGVGVFAAADIPGVGVPAASAERLEPACPASQNVPSVHASKSKTTKHPASPPARTCWLFGRTAAAGRGTGGCAGGGGGTGRARAGGAGGGGGGGAGGAGGALSACPAATARWQCWHLSPATQPACSWLPQCGQYNIFSSCGILSKGFRDKGIRCPWSGESGDPQPSGSVKSPCCGPPRYQPFLLNPIPHNPQPHIYSYSIFLF